MRFVTVQCVNRVLLVVVALWFAAPVRAAEDPLGSWYDGPAKQAISDFVKAATDPASTSFV